MKRFNQFMTENRTTALLPATRTLFGKNKVTSKEAADYMGDFGHSKSTIQVAHKDGDPKKPAFIFGSGHTPHQEGKVIHAHHDQTGAKMGSFHVVNTIHYTGNEATWSHKAVDSNMKAPLHVYK